MKNVFYKSMNIVVVLAMVLAISCAKDGADGIDGLIGPQGPMGEQGPKGDPGDTTQVEEIAIFGQWEVIAGQLGVDASKLLYLNEDNTINILSEDKMGFKRAYTTNITITTDQITMRDESYGVSINNYILDNDILTIIPPGEAEPTVLQKVENGPNPSEWVKSLTILDEGEVPWDREVDIAFDGEYLLGFDENEGSILKINPVDFTIVDNIATSRSAYAVEIEKSDAPTRQLFQSSNGSSNFFSYVYSSNSLYYTSENLGSWIRGIASIEPGLLWASSSSMNALYHYKSNGSLSPGEILETIPLDIVPGGLDYRNGYLYISERNYIHKCQTTPEFKALETYEVKGHSIDGVTFDGVNFWLSARSWEENTHKLLKVDLPL
ncbi:hypothetical protein ACOCEA_17275 [Maribacter sp. CXY002]|uniref:hypothetical protein n=1 Tax=Maribacter luteocoastalis TaxID=3407671 RepID=UPI003B67EAF6